MTRRVPFAALLFILLSAFNPAQAAEFKSVGAIPAVAYNAPSDKARKVFVAPRGMPVEIILAQDDWTKVRDSAGDLFWLQSKSLTAKRNVIVTAPPGLKLHATADEASVTVATIDKGVLLELVTPASSGWVKLKHRDGPTGFARIGEVWGE